jgi:hypothetical protein
MIGAVFGAKNGDSGLEPQLRRFAIPNGKGDTIMHNLRYLSRSAVLIAAVYSG